MLELLAATRFFHFLAIVLLFGLSVFPFYAVRPNGEAVSFRGPITLCAAASLVSGVLVLMGAAANIGGDLASAWDAGTLSNVIGDTEFGRVWAGRLVLCLPILALRLRPKGGADAPLAVLSGLLLASVALTGHSRMPTGVLGAVSVLADALHLLAAGWWIGGLLGLVLAARALGPDLAGMLTRFSGIGYGAVAALILTGTFKSWLLLGRAGAMVSTLYGWTLMVKLLLFAGMGALALSNRLWITPALGRETARAGVWLNRLRGQVALELALGVLVLAAVGLLGAMEPPVDFARP
jgi:putative copper resistance protein D